MIFMKADQEIKTKKLSILGIKEGCHYRFYIYYYKI